MQDVEQFQVEGQKVEAEEVADGNLEEGQETVEGMKEDDNRREPWIPRAVDNLDWHAVVDNLEEDVAVGNLVVVFAGQSIVVGKEGTMVEAAVQEDSLKNRHPTSYKKLGSGNHHETDTGYSTACNIPRCYDCCSCGENI